MDSNVCMVNDFTELNDLIEKSHSVKADLSDEIKNILTRRSELEHKLEKISSLIPDFHKLQVNAENSSKLVGCASELALQLSGKVEQLDFVKNHVLKCVEKLSHIITLKNSALGAKGCLVDNKLDEAAGYVFTYLKMDKDIISLVSRLAEGKLITLKL
ncbi:conserved oligomeric Golgi complex subunit 4 [Schistosoma japonicum]|nr:conserved oligomeric Golgi complex subunit 4 [Schistosoma japonicum]